MITKHSNLQKYWNNVYIRMAKLKALRLTAALKVVYFNYLNLTAIIALPLDSRCQFRQHFIRDFFVQKQIAQLSLVMLQHVVFGAKFRTKNVIKM